ncbi:MAG: M3 family metallopeptidase [Burkholderiales bacterium]|nr:M3 family metallopeptidase [Burkholderiales bacterium]
MNAIAETNPLLAEWKSPFGLPPFDRIKPEHFRPAFDIAFAGHRAEIAAIAGNPEPPTFANTIDALELAGERLSRVGGVFWNLAGSHTNAELQAIEREISPVAAKHYSDIGMNGALFARIDTLLAAAPTLSLDAEQRRVLDLTHRRFIRSGARLGTDEKARLSQIVERLATLGTQFSQNVLADEAGYQLVLETDDDRAGLPDWLLAAAARVADERGLPGKHVITLSRSLIEPFLQFSTRADLRNAAFAAWTSRGETGGNTDNRAIVAETLALRVERARLLGYPSFAAYKLDGTMAKTPGAVNDLLGQVWPMARARAEEEREELEALAGEPVDAASWRYWSDKVRKARYDLDEAAIKPYLQLDRMIEAAFDTATRLFGVTFHSQTDLSLYHPDARAWDVRDASGSHVALFIGDYFARPSKRSGAWMSSFRGQRRLGKDVRPLVVNVLNFAKGGEGGPTLLSFDDARTIFHEFGHALHGMLSQVTYPSVAGTSVPRDFVEFPSQVYEHWLMRPEVLKRYAVHAQTGEPIPDELLAKINRARAFNQGFATVEYTASAIVDMEFHALADAGAVDPMAMEAAILARLGMPRGLVMRHRTPHFTHVFSGDGYSAGYYSYMWSEVLDADGFTAFEDAGDIFDPTLARRLKDHVYAAGNRVDPAESYRAFRGRDPDVSALLRKRGFLQEVAEAGGEER